MSYQFKQNVKQESLKEGKVTAYDIDWDIDLDEAYEKLDNMSDKNASLYLGLTLNKYQEMSEEDRHDYAEDMWHHGRLNLPKFMGIKIDIIIPDEVITDWKENDKDDEIITDYLSDTYGYCINGYQLFDYDEEYTKASELIMKSMYGYNNGHSEYIIADVNKEDFTKFLTDTYLSQDFTELYRGGIGNLHFEQNNGYTIALFSTCEKYPEMNTLISQAFPEANIYGLGEWDIKGMEAIKNTYQAKLNDCWQEFGVLGISIELTDNKTGYSFKLENTFPFEHSVDGNGEVFLDTDTEEYKYFMSLLNGDEKQQVEDKLDDCREFIKMDNEMER